MITYDEVPEGTPTMRAGTNCVSSFACLHTSVIVTYLMRATSHDKIQLKRSVFSKLVCDDVLVFES